MLRISLAGFFLLSSLTQPAPAQTPKKDVPKAQTFKGQITNADAFDAVRKNSHQKTHFMKMIPGYTYTIDMSARFDTYLRLEDSKGKHLAANDDFQGLNSRIIFTPKRADTYRVIATTLRAGSTGFYTVSVRPAKGNGAAQVVLRLQGKLTKKDPIDAVRKNCHYRVHNLKMESGKTYVIFSATETYDGYLRLEDAKGNRLTENDDYRDTRHSRIAFTPTKTATYRIVVTTFSAGATGSYTLSVTR